MFRYLALSSANLSKLKEQNEVVFHFEYEIKFTFNPGAIFDIISNFFQETVDYEALHVLKWLIYLIIWPWLLLLVHWLSQ